MWAISAWKMPMSQKFKIQKLVRMVAAGEVDPTVILTQDKPLGSALGAFEHFDRRERGWIKVELEPAH
jgi:threonine dehydrogenase-like Zn-dependent dehydrogenase